ncbi:MAG: hypothetical protein R3F65_16995 [bacterium]
MKRVPRPAGETPGLADYRRDHPDEVAAPVTEGAAIWERFRDSDGGARYRALLDALTACQQGLCGYCEQRLTHPAKHPRAGERRHGDYQVEHVEPKSAVVGAALDEANLMLACGGGTCMNRRDASRDRASARRRANESCGQHKGNGSLPAGCDPRMFGWDRPVVRISSDGRINADEAACRMSGIDPAMLDHAIDDVLNLNCERLRVARQEIVDHIVGEVMPSVELLVDASPELSASERQAILTLIIGSHLRPDGHGHLKAFWSTWRGHLGHLGGFAEQWLAANHALLNWSGA